MSLFDVEGWLILLGLVVIVAPLLLTVVLALPAFLRWRLPEDVTSRAVQVAVVLGLTCAVAILVLMLATGARSVPIALGNWVVVPHYHFSVKFVFDRLSVPFVILSFVLCGTVGAFARRYMHREPGFDRFFQLYAVFLLGMIWTSLAGTIETLFAGWELVGLSSALLVAFFQERPMPVRNGLRVWVVYRVADAAFLLAAVVMHHATGEGDFAQMLGATPWPDGQSPLAPSLALVIGLMLLVAAAGKSALVPFSGWLPRAMEGPTPSSAVFYGALSVHLGAFLLLRVSPLLDASLALSAAVVALGLATALYAYVAGSAQTDIKSALAFASLVQVGLIVAEIGLGLRYIALVHILGHACLRTLQFLRAPTLLHDHHTLENAVGGRLSTPRASWLWMFSERGRTWAYRFALERGYLDSLLDTFIVRPFLGLFRACDALERKWTDLLSGRASRESDEVKPRPELMDEFS
jgi:NAD(P)H-quinone oxidoreductase subunit 5